MGRQIHLYMLPADRNEFLRVIQKYGPTDIVLRDFDSSHVQPIAGPASADKTLCLWNRRLIPSLERKWVPEPGYYRIDTLNEPIIEFTPSFTATWCGKPSLGQGRLFGNFEPYLGKPADFGGWYGSLVRWIRQHYRKNRATTGGYIGPAAYELYEQGGYLLPNFLPPKTKEWLAEIAGQHKQSMTVSRSRNSAKARS